MALVVKRKVLHSLFSLVLLTMRAACCRVIALTSCWHFWFGCCRRRSVSFPAILSCRKFGQIRHEQVFERTRIGRMAVFEAGLARLDQVRDVIGARGVDHRVALRDDVRNVGRRRPGDLDIGDMGGEFAHAGAHDGDVFLEIGDGRHPHARIEPGQRLPRPLRGNEAQPQDIGAPGSSPALRHRDARRSARYRPRARCLRASSETLSASSVRICTWSVALSTGLDLRHIVAARAFENGDEDDPQPRLGLAQLRLRIDHRDQRHGRHAQLFGLADEDFDIRRAAR